MPDHDLLTKAMYLYKILMDKHARINGGTVTYLSQHSVLWGIQAQDSHLMGKHSYSGVCAGLAIEWIRATLKGEDFIGALNTARNEMMTQGKSKGFGTDTDALFTGVENAHFEQKNVKKAFKAVATFKKEVSLKYPFGGAARNFENGRFYCIGTRTHATAAFCRGETMAFYDPNVGVANGVKKKMIEEYFKECIEETLRLTGADMSSAKKLELTVVGFKPL